MICTVHIYYCKHGATDFEMAYNHGYGKGITAQNKGLL